MEPPPDRSTGPQASLAQRSDLQQLSKSSMQASGSLGPSGIQVTNLATNKRSSQNLGGRSSLKAKKPQCTYEEKAEGGFIMRGMKPTMRSLLSSNISQL